MDSKISAPAQSTVQFDWKDEDLTTSTLYASSQDTITISAALDNMSASPYSVTGAIGTSFSNSIWTTGTGTTTAPWLSNNPTGAKIQLDGEAADITVNGWSLIDAVKRIEQRLGLFQPNPELEKEWEDLRELGERYRKLEQHIKDKQATFERLKAMPAPEVE
jgi:hypothetical protein